MKTALIVEGGAMRGIYSAGILDTFLQNQFNPFDLCIAVSSGASNAAAYLGGKYGRQYAVYTDYCRRPQFKNLRRFLTGGHLIDLDWLWTLVEEELPIGREQIFTSETEFLITVAAAQSGYAHHLAPSPENLYELLKASSCMPIAYRNRVIVDQQHWFDGGVSDSIPVEEAYQRGAQKIMILRSNPQSYVKHAYRYPRLIRFLLRKYPGIAARLVHRHQDYNQTLSFIRNPPSDCEIIEICPPDEFSASQFTMDLPTLDQAYQFGRKDGEQAMQRWQQR